MNTFIKIALLILFPLFLHGQKPLKEIETLIEKASQLALKDVNQAENVALLALEDAKTTQNQKLIAICYRTLADIIIKKGDAANHQKSIDYIEKSLLLFRKTDDSLEVFKSINNLANSYRKLHQLPKAMRYAQEGLDLMKNLNQDNKFQKEFGIANFTLAYVYQDSQLYESSLEHYTTASEVFEQISSPYLSYCFTNIAIVLSKKKQFSKASVYYKKAKVIFLQNKNWPNYIKTTHNLGELSIKLNAFAQAKQNLNESLKMSKKIGYNDLYAGSLFNLAKVYLKEKKIDSSFYYIDSAIYISDSLNMSLIQLESLNLKANLHEIQGDSTKANIYYHQAQKLDDSLKSVQAIPNTAQLVIQNQKEKFNHQSKKYETQLQQQTYKLILSLLVLLVLAVGTLIILKKHKRTLAKRSIEKDKLEHQLVSSIENKDYLMRKLSATQINLATQNEALQKANLLLKKIQTKYHLNGLGEELRETQDQLKSQLENDRLWDDFFFHFEKVHPTFLNKLSEQFKLSQSDLKLCAFIKMNLSNKDICKLMHINPTSIRVIRHRLKKKLEIEKEQSVSEFLRSLS